MVQADGDNFRIELDLLGFAIARVWKRPDLDSQRGARGAELLARALADLAQRRVARGLLLDLTDAPPAFGPRTEAAIASVLEAFEAAGRPAVVLIGDSPVQRLQYDRVLQRYAPGVGRLTARRDEAMGWLHTSRRVSLR